MDSDPFQIKADKINDNKLNGKYSRSWVEESIALEKRSGRHQPVLGTRNYIGNSISKKNLLIFLTAVGAVFFLIIAKSLFIQIIKGDYYSALAEGNRLRIRPIPSERGIIYDRFGKQLVQNIPSFNLAIVPQDLPTDPIARNELIVRVAQNSGVPAEDIQNLIKKYKNYSYESLVLKENVDYETALRLYIDSADSPGILIESGSKRDYLYVHEEKNDAILSLTHILGYLGKLNDQEFIDLRNSGYLLSDNLGKTGIEKTYESILRGQYGKKKVEVNAAGQEQNVVAQEAPTSGKNLYLSIDIEAQKKLEDLIKQMAAATKKNRFSAVALNPQNGEIIALVSWPTYNNNLFSEGISRADYEKYISDPDKPLFNRAIAGAFPSGSTIKLVVAAAALEEGIINVHTAILSAGGIQVGDWFFPDWKAGGHGVTDVTKAIAWSINSFFYYVGGGYKNFVGLGADKLIGYMKKFGLAQKTGIDLPGENSGFLPSQEWKQETKGEKWYIGDTYNLSIGQGDLLVTPLQVAVWTAAIANGGHLITPHLSLKTSDPKTKTETTFNLMNKDNQIVSANNINIVKNGAQECVSSGSCQLLKTLPFTSGGKTGTAQWSKTKKEHAWFTAFAPYDNPKIVITVLGEECGEGAFVSMPITRDFLSWWGGKYLNTRR